MARVTSPAAKKIGHVARELRKARGFTQDDVAGLTSIDAASIRAYESGRGLPSLHALFRIAHALEVTPEVLLDGVALDDFPEHGNTGRAL